MVPMILIQVTWRPVDSNVLLASETLKRIIMSNRPSMSVEIWYMFEEESKII